MRMIGTIFLLSIPLAATAQPRVDGAAGRACERAGVAEAADPHAAARFRRLGDLPPANEVLTLLRSENGCTRPVIVRYGIGAGAPSLPGNAQRTGPE